MLTKFTKGINPLISHLSSNTHFSVVKAAGPVTARLSKFTSFKYYPDCKIAPKQSGTNTITSAVDKQASRFHIICVWLSCRRSGRQKFIITVNMIKMEEQPEK